MSGFVIRELTDLAQYLLWTFRMASGSECKSLALQRESAWWAECACVNMYLHVSQPLTHTRLTEIVCPLLSNSVASPPSSNRTLPDLPLHKSGKSAIFCNLRRARKNWPFRPKPRGRIARSCEHCTRPALKVSSRKAVWKDLAKPYSTAAGCCGTKTEMAAERPGKRACLDTFLFTSESVGEGHAGEPCTTKTAVALVFLRGSWRGSLPEASLCGSLALMPLRRWLCGLLRLRLS